MNAGEYWLKEVLLKFQSKDEQKHHDAWMYIGKITGRNASSFSSVAEAIACAYAGLGGDAERDKFLCELEGLVQFSKEHKFSSETMDSLLLVVALLRKMDRFAEIFARSFVFTWRNAGERLFLSARFLSLCEDCGRSAEIFNAVSHLHKHKWIPRGHAIDACNVLLESNPDKWFSTLARMLPAMSRYKNKLIREEGEAGLKMWAIAETCLLEKIKYLENEE